MNRTRIVSFLAVAASLALSVSLTQAQVRIAAGNADVIYRESFDHLPAQGRHVWKNNETLAGWYANRDEFSAIGANRKPTPAPGVYSLGGGADRALGATASVKSPLWIGVCLLNETGETIQRLDVSYVIKQFRRGDPSNELKLEYQVARPGQAKLETASDWIPVTAANFTNTEVGEGALTPPLLHEMSVGLSALDWKAGEELWLRWVFTKKRNNGLALGIDSLTIKKTGGDRF